MEVYRLAPGKFAQDLSGTGAKIYGGRWNHKGIPCVYTAESRALAVVELAANVSADNFPPDLKMITLEIPSKNIFAVSAEELPANWREFPAPDELRHIGSQLLLTGRYLVIRVPSAVVPQEFNYFLNPLHKDFDRLVRVVDLVPFEFDSRIKQ